MTRLGQMLFDEGWDQGWDQSRDQINRLNTKLMEDDRLDDLKKSLSDKEYQKKLLAEYHLDRQQESRARV